MESIINSINNILWSNALIALCLGTGLYFSLRTRFLQVRHLNEMVVLLAKGEK
ncbi:hypothetical protein [Paraclostridium bifermentans]|nr:hypothetical protein [Paraclostridium bifermentans]